MDKYDKVFEEKRKILNTKSRYIGLYHTVFYIITLMIVFLLGALIYKLITI